MMKRKNVGILASAIAAALLLNTAGECFYSSQNAADGQKKEEKKVGGKVSTERISFISGLVSEYIRSGENLDDPDVKESIYSNISKVMPLKPLGKPKEYSYRELAEKVNEYVNRQISTSSSDVEAKAMAEAEAKYKMTPLREEVLVEYKKGPFSYKYRGTLYKFNSKDVQVDDMYIQYIDMIHSSRVKLDARYNKQVKQDYVNKKISEFSLELNMKRFNIQEQLTQEQRRENETLGYLFDTVENRWVDAKQYADSLMAPDSKLRQTVKPTKSGTASQSAGEGSGDEDNPYENAVAKAKAQLDDINSKYYGIDADEGYKLAVWGTARQDQQILLSKEKEFNTLKRLVSADVFSVEGGRAELHYLNNVLVKTVFRKDDCVSDVFRVFYNELHDKYGSPKVNGEVMDGDVFAQIVSGKLKSKKTSGTDGDKKYTLVWAGEKTIGTLEFSCSADNKQFKSIVYTKEYKSSAKK